MPLLASHLQARHDERLLGRREAGATFLPGLLELPASLRGGSKPQTLGRQTAATKKGTVRSRYLHIPLQALFQRFDLILEQELCARRRAQVAAARKVSHIAQHSKSRLVALAQGISCSIAQRQHTCSIALGLGYRSISSGTFSGRLVKLSSGPWRLEPPTSAFGRVSLL